MRRKRSLRRKVLVYADAYAIIFFLDSLRSGLRKRVRRLHFGCF